MKIAIPHWQGRISPVFDVAAHVLIVEIDGARELNRREATFDVEEPRARAAQLVAADTNILICGALSGPLATALSAVDIEVFSHICGDMESVLTAFVEGRLNQDVFLMPGCCGHRRRARAGHGRGRQRGTQKPSLQKEGGGTMPQGDGTGPPKGSGRGRGRRGGPFAGSPAAHCVCPSCGHRIKHDSGRPCSRTACPKCAAMMVRDQ